MEVALRPDVKLRGRSPAHQFVSLEAGAYGSVAWFVVKGLEAGVNEALQKDWEKRLAERRARNAANRARARRCARKWLALGLDRLTSVGPFGAARTRGPSRAPRRHAHSIRRRAAAARSPGRPGDDDPSPVARSRRLRDTPRAN
jgi:hypothetical protein